VVLYVLEKNNMTKQEIREAINSICDEVTEVGAAVGVDLARNEEGFIVDTSDLGIAVRAIEHANMRLSRLSFALK
jgi:hypothetical protein